MSFNHSTNKDETSNNNKLGNFTVAIILVEKPDKKPAHLVRWQVKAVMLTMNRDESEEKQCRLKKRVYSSTEVMKGHFERSQIVV